MIIPVAVLWGAALLASLLIVNPLVHGSETNCTVTNKKQLETKQGYALIVQTENCGELNASKSFGGISGPDKIYRSIHIGEAYNFKTRGGRIGDFFIPRIISAEKVERVDSNGS